MHNMHASYVCEVHMRSYSVCMSLESALIHLSLLLHVTCGGIVIASFCLRQARSLQELLDLRGDLLRDCVPNRGALGPFHRLGKPAICTGTHHTQASRSVGI